MRQNGRVSFDRKRVLRDSLSVAIPVGSYGVAFGAASVSAGFSVAQSSVLSLFLFSGASQFAVVGVMGAGGGVLSAVLTATLLGLRNMFYGFRNAPLLRLAGHIVDIALVRGHASNVIVQRDKAVTTLG